MDLEIATPSKNEWLIMEVVWRENGSITAAEIIVALNGIKDVSKKTIRSMIKRLVEKEILNFYISSQNSRVYRYFPLISREECQHAKSRRFVTSYFGGDTLQAVTLLLQAAELSQDQFLQFEQLVHTFKLEHGKI